MYTYRAPPRERRGPDPTPRHRCHPSPPPAREGVSVGTDTVQHVHVHVHVDILFLNRAIAFRPSGECTLCLAASSTAWRALGRRRNRRHSRRFHSQSGCGRPDGAEVSLGESSTLCDAGRCRKLAGTGRAAFLIFILTPGPSQQSFQGGTTQPWLPTPRRSSRQTRHATS